MHPTASKTARQAAHPAVHSINQDLKPEWLRVPDAVRLFGVGRTSLYELIKSGAIKSTSLKKRGNVQGIRLISYESLAALVEGSAAMEGAQ